LISIFACSAIVSEVGGGTSAGVTAGCVSGLTGASGFAGASFIAASGAAAGADAAGARGSEDTFAGAAGILSVCWKATSMM
jgi:hypothetical protein